MREQRQIWHEAFEALLQFGSQGAFEREILRAKEIFYQNLGRAHEMLEDLYESSSQSFLEWYLFEYQTRNFQKTPAIIFVTLGMGSEIHLKIIKQSIHNHWSLYKVCGRRGNQVEVEDLLWGKSRIILVDRSWPEVQGWKVKKGQVFQARLFPLSDSGDYFLTHLWLHPEKEYNLLMDLCAKRVKLWSLHKDLLLASFEAAVRSYGLEKQLKISQASNWNYAELVKRYAEAN